MGKEDFARAVKGARMMKARLLFSRLRPDISLHISPKGGSLSTKKTRYSFSISRLTAKALIACDGTKRLNEILDNLYHDHSTETPIELCQVAVELANLISNGILETDVKPFYALPHVTGDFEILYPVNLQVELTTGCNLNCYYCYRNAHFSKDTNRLPTADLLRILDDLGRRGLKSVELTGGEPMFHPDFLRIFEFCKDRFELVGLLTNGTMLTKAALDCMRTVKDKIVVSVSLDSHDSAKHDLRRGRQGAHARTTEAISNFASLGLLTRVSMAVDEDNWEDIEGTATLAQSLGARLFTHAPILPFGRGQQSSKQWTRNAHDVLASEQHLQKRFAGFFDLMPETVLARIGEPGGCGAGWRAYAMDPKGMVRPCVTFDEHLAIFGDLTLQSPEEVFGGALAQAFAELRPPNEESCNGCENALFCRNCAYRGLNASLALGRESCTWLREPKIGAWLNLIEG